MSDLLKKILGVYIDPEEQRILDAIESSGLKTMRVVGRGTLTVDAEEVINTDKFKEYAKQAREIVVSSN